MARDILDRTEARVREALDLADLEIKAIDYGEWVAFGGGGYPYIILRFEDRFERDMARSILASHRLETFSGVLPDALHIICEPNPASYFGGLVGEIRRVTQSTADRHNDVDLWNGPAECHGSIRKDTERQLREVLEKHKITPTQYGFLVEARTGPKWAFFSGHMAAVMALDGAA